MIDCRLRAECALSSGSREEQRSDPPLEHRLRPTVERTVRTGRVVRRQQRAPRPGRDGSSVRVASLAGECSSSRKGRFRRRPGRLLLFVQSRSAERDYGVSIEWVPASSAGKPIPCGDGVASGFSLLDRDRERLTDVTGRTAGPDDPAGAAVQRLTAVAGSGRFRI
jgi:hypothetical protein